jgi:nitrate reductase delta subunit
LNAYKLISLLLQYPEQRMLEARTEIAREVSLLPPGPQRAAIARFLDFLRDGDAVRLQQDYVRTFDFQKRLSLHLTFYLYGDRRQRGLALLRLKRCYAAAGLPLATTELPDYAPVVLEFAAAAPDGYGDRILREFRPALELIRLALRDLGSPYGYLFDAICLGLPVLTEEEQEQIRRLAAEGPPTEQVGLEPFGPPEVMPLVPDQRTDCAVPPRKAAPLQGNSSDTTPAVGGVAR